LQAQADTKYRSGRKNAKRRQTGMARITKPKDRRNECEGGSIGREEPGAKGEKGKARRKCQSGWESKGESGDFRKVEAIVSRGK